MTAKKTAMSRMAILSALAASAVALSTPAMAQSYRADAGQQINAREGQMVDRIAAANQGRQLSRNEIDSLRNQMASFRVSEQRYRANGLTGWEAQELNRLLDNIQRNLSRDRADAGRYDRDYRYDGGRQNDYGYGRY